MSSIITDHQRYIEKQWTHQGIECAILSHPSCGHMNGYVRVSDPSKLPKDLELHDLFDVHGGITYGPDDEGWVGFDTAHGGDLWPSLPDPLELAGIYKDYDYVNNWTIDKLEAEVNRLAEQVSEL